MASDAMRAEFEKEVLRRYPNSNLARSQDGYAHTATHSAVPMTYASIQMLWEVWQAARRTPAPEVAGSSDREDAPFNCRMPDGRCAACGGDWSVCGCQGMFNRAARSLKESPSVRASLDEGESNA